MVPYVAVTTADRIGAITSIVTTRGPCELTRAEDPLEVSSTTAMMRAPGASGKPSDVVSGRPGLSDAPAPLAYRRAN